MAAALFLLSLVALLDPGAPNVLVLPLGLPWLGMHLRLDALTAFFMLVVNLGAVLVSLYALGYGKGESAPRRVLPFVPAFLAGMNLVLLADDAFTFLLSWEFMSLTSWALVLREHENPQAREGAYLYLVMASLGTAVPPAVLRPAGGPGRRLRLCQHSRPRPGGLLAAPGAPAGGARRRLQGGPGAPARLAAAGTCRGTQPCLGADERGDDQGRGLCRHAALARSGRAARLVVGCGADGDGCDLGGSRPALCAHASRSEAVPGLQHGRESGHHLHRSRVRARLHRQRAARGRRDRAIGRSPARLEPYAVQEPAVHGCGCGAARDARA